MEKKKELTKRQKEVLNIIYNHIKSSGFPPSFEEFKEELEISSNQSLLDLLKHLEEKGYIKREEGSARAIRILRKGFDALRVPLFMPVVGTTSAGQFIEAIEEAGTWQELSKDVYKLNFDESMILRVNGDSMIGAGIDDGDMVIVRRAREFNSGEIVLAASMEGTTVKRFISESRRIYLKPENPKYNIIPFTEEARLIGKVVFNLTKNRNV